MAMISRTIPPHTMVCSGDVPNNVSPMIPPERPGRRKARSTRLSIARPVREGAFYS